MRIRRLRDRVYHSPKILQRRVELHVMRRPQDQPAAFAERLQPAQHFGAHVGRRTKRQRVLHIHRTPETEIPAIFLLKLRQIHAGRLDRVEHIQTDLDQVGDDRVDDAVRMIGYLDLRVDRLQFGDEGCHAVA